jgi:hypothetical protein
MANSIPFSITPDAEDFLRDRIEEMPHGMEPVLMMVTFQSDGLNPPRWFFHGESFVFGFIHPKELSKAEYTSCELFGRHIFVTSEALDHLSGRTLALRRVDAHYGLRRGTQYVMVADSVPVSQNPVSNESRFIQQIERGIPIGALTILGGFTGMGVVWIASALTLAILRIQNDKLFIFVEYLFVPGWILGAIISFFYFRSIYKTNGQTRFTQEQRRKKYLGPGGLQWEMDWWIFLGIPASLMAILLITLLPFARSDSQKAYGSVIALMIVNGASLYFCDKIPRRLITRLGILGWVVTLVIGCFFFKIHGP